MQESRAYEDYHFNDKGELVIEARQTVGNDYFDNLKHAQDEVAFRLNGLTPVAAIPEVVVYRWLREGFDFYSAPAREIQKKLSSENLEGMMVTQKTFSSVGPVLKRII